MILFLLLACTGGATDSTDDVTDDTTGDKTDDTGTTPTGTTTGTTPSGTATGTTPTGGTAPTGTTGGCARVNSGDDWAWNGQCPQMFTPCDLTVDACTIAIDYRADGGMTMGMPHGGTISGDTVTFNNDNGVTGCVGTVIDADTIEGSCDGGCTFSLER